MVSAESWVRSLDDATRSQEEDMVRRYYFPQSMSPSTPSVEFRSDDLTEVNSFPSQISGSPHPSLHSHHSIDRRSHISVRSATPLTYRTLPQGSVRASSRATSRGSGVGPIRRRRGDIVAGDANLDDLARVNTGARGFRFSSKTYFITWSQIVGGLI